MPTDPNNVLKLVDAARIGLEIEMGRGDYTAEDVINATFTLVAASIRYCCAHNPELSPEQMRENRQAVRRGIEHLLLETTTDEQAH